MDELLSRASNQAVTFAIRSGISLASGFAIKTVTKFLDKIPEENKTKILVTKNKIQRKIDVLTVTIDLIKLAAAKGNSSLESSVALINEFAEEIGKFEESINTITEDLTNSNEKHSIKKVEDYMSSLLEQINENIPILTLSLISSGVNLRADLPSSISPGRLLQASNYLGASHQNFGKESLIVGPSFDLAFYSIFYNPSRVKYIKEDENTSSEDLSCISWKEEFARCTGSIYRASTNDLAISYELRIEEDFNDGRYHEDSSTPGSHIVKIENLVKQFFTASGKLLRLESRNSPILILKLAEGKGKYNWIGLGEVADNEFEDSDEENDSDNESSDESEDREETKDPKKSDKSQGESKSSTLSLLDYLLRLCKVEQVEQKSILELTDEQLTLHIRENHNSSKENDNYDYNPLPAVSNNDITMNSNTIRLDNLKLGK